jgi:hypothetical protein
VARATAERAAFAGAMAPILAIDRGLDRLRDLRPPSPGLAAGAGLALSALTLVLPGGLGRVVRRGIALVQLGGSLKRLFTSGHTDPPHGGS